MSSPLTSRTYFTRGGGTAPVQSITEASGGGGGMPFDPRLFMELINEKRATAAFERDRASRADDLNAKLAMEDLLMKRQQRQAAGRSRGSSGGNSGGSAGGGHRQATGSSVGGKPIFVKTVGGPGMQGGTIRLNAWEPGAAFAGYESQLGGAPDKVVMEAPGPSMAGLAASPANVPAAGSYSAGIPTAGTRVGGPDERADWLGTGTTNVGDQRNYLATRAKEREEEAAQRAMETWLGLPPGGSRMLPSFYGGRR